MTLVLCTRPSGPSKSTCISSCIHRKKNSESMHDKIGTVHFDDRGNMLMNFIVLV